MEKITQWGYIKEISLKDLDLKNSTFLDEGKYGYIYSVTNPTTGNHYVLKIFHIPNDEIGELVNYLLWLPRHYPQLVYQGIMPHYYAKASCSLDGNKISEDPAGYPCVIMDYVPGTHLEKYLVDQANTEKLPVTSPACLDNLTMPHPYLEIWKDKLRLS
ncbi:MAG: hypothetical protein NTY03_04150, partial [Candidatus Bathyarchaeota archaeon]|nr:hypothetical protein [Candidatus Bathyarchaeota archaeon]